MWLEQGWVGTFGEIMSTLILSLYPSRPGRSRLENKSDYLITKYKFDHRHTLFVLNYLKSVGIYWQNQGAILHIQSHV